MSISAVFSLNDCCDISQRSGCFPKETIAHYILVELFSFVKIYTFTTQVWYFGLLFRTRRIRICNKKKSVCPPYTLRMDFQHATSRIYKRYIIQYYQSRKKQIKINLFHKKLFISNHNNFNSVPYIVFNSADLQGLSLRRAVSISFSLKCNWTFFVDNLKLNKFCLNVFFLDTMHISWKTGKTKKMYFDLNH